MHEWFPSECAPLNAPMEILSGRFITRDNVPVRIATGGVLNNGWGAIGSTFITPPARKALPERLELTWFSYAENKCYKGDFLIDAARLDTLFEAGYLSPVTGTRKEFDRIVVGMAPGGGVALWLKGELITREAAFFQAAESDERWTLPDGAQGSRSEYVQAQLEALLDKEQIAGALAGARAGAARWQDAYRRPWNWSPKLISRARVRTLLIRYFNGETLQHAADGVPAALPLPEQLDLYWANPDGLNYGATIRLEFNELSQAFGMLAPGGAIQLNLEVDTLNASVAVFLQNSTEAYTLRNASIRAFRM